MNHKTLILSVNKSNGVDELVIATLINPDTNTEVTITVPNSEFDKGLGFSDEVRAMIDAFLQADVAMARKNMGSISERIKEFEEFLKQTTKEAQVSESSHEDEDESFPGFLKDLLTRLVNEPEEDESHGKGKSNNTIL